jgi:hypothetical protein
MVVFRPSVDGPVLTKLGSEENSGQFKSTQVKVFLEGKHKNGNKKTVYRPTVTCLIVLRACLYASQVCCTTD